MLDRDNDGGFVFPIFDRGWGLFSPFEAKVGVILFDFFEFAPLVDSFSLAIAAIFKLFFVDFDEVLTMPLLEAIS